MFLKRKSECQDTENNFKAARKIDHIYNEHYPNLTHLNDYNEN